MLRKHRPLLCPYADNGNVVSYDEDDARVYIATLCRLLLGYGLKYRIEALAAGAHDTLGVSFDARHGLVTNKHLRMWRLRGAIYELCEQGECSGDVLRVIVGHTVHACMLARHALCILSSCYKFMVDYEDDVEPLPSPPLRR